MDDMAMLKRIRAWWRGRRNARKAKKMAAARVRWDQRFSSADFVAANIKSVALLRWDDKLGDAIISTVFLTALAKHRPDIQVTVLTGIKSAPLFSGCPGKVNVEVLEKRSWDTARSLDRFAGQFDLVLELGSSLGDRDLFALYQLRASHYLGYGKQSFRIFDIHLPLSAQHFAQRYAEAARLLCPSAKVEQEFFVVRNANDEACAQQFYAGFSSMPKVVINLFGSASHRQFNYREGLALIAWWKQHFHGHELILLRVPGQDTLLQALASATGVHVSPQPVSLPLTMAILDRADLVVSPDTSVVHFAGALDKPLLAIYNANPANFEEWAPLSRQRAIVFTREPEIVNDKVRVAEFSWGDLEAAVGELLPASRSTVESDGSVFT